jgi:hypothetical protein
MIRPGLVYFAEEPALKVSIFAQTLSTGELTLVKAGVGYDGTQSR